MSRRPVNPTRRLVDSGNTSFGASLQSKARSTPLLSLGLVLLGAILLIAYSYSSPGQTRGSNTVSKLEGGVSCTFELQQALPILKKAYGDKMRKVLHVGPDTCSVVSKLLKEDDMEAWGVEPYDIDDADNQCRNLVRKGFVRVADIKFPLPYRANSFSLVIISDALDYLSPRYLNKTLPELARVSSEGIVILTALTVFKIYKAYGGHQPSSVLVIQDEIELRLLSYPNLVVRPNYGAPLGGLDFSYKQNWRRMKLQQRSLSRLQPSDLTSRLVKFST